MRHAYQLAISGRQKIADWSQQMWVNSSRVILPKYFFKVLIHYSFMYYCYTSIQYTCTQLVQITSRDVIKYALLTGQQCVQPNWRCQFFSSKKNLFNFLVLGYIKTYSNWIVDHRWKFLTLCFKNVLDLGQHFTNIRVKNVHWCPRRQSLFVWYLKNTGHTF